MTFSWGAFSWSFPCVCCLPLQIVMAPHEQAEEFIASYTKLMHGDTDTTNFQKVLEMKVKHPPPSLPLLHSHTHTCTCVGSETQWAARIDWALQGEGGGYEQGRLQPISGWQGTHSAYQETGKTNAVLMATSDQLVVLYQKLLFWYCAKKLITK